MNSGVDVLKYRDKTKLQVCVWHWELLFEMIELNLQPLQPLANVIENEILSCMWLEIKTL